MEKIKVDLNESHIYLKDHLNTKISLDKLDEAEEKHQLLVDRVVSNINKRYMERKEVKKALALLEK